METLTAKEYPCQHLRVPWSLQSFEDVALPTIGILIGWDIAAGLALHASRSLRSPLAGLICINGFYNAPRLQTTCPTGWQWAQSQFAPIPTDFVPDAHLGHLKQIPLLIIHSQNNTLYPPDEAKMLYRKYPGPKTLVFLPNVDHRQWLTPTHPMFEHAIQVIDHWLQKLKTHPLVVFSCVCFVRMLYS